MLRILIIPLLALALFVGQFPYPVEEWTDAEFRLSPLGPLYAQVTFTIEVVSGSIQLKYAYNRGHVHTTSSTYTDYVLVPLGFPIEFLGDNFTGTVDNLDLEEGVQ